MHSENRMSPFSGLKKPVRSDWADITGANVQQPAPVSALCRLLLGTKACFPFSFFHVIFLSVLEKENPLRRLFTFQKQYVCKACRSQPFHCCAEKIIFSPVHIISDGSRALIFHLRSKKCPKQRDQRPWNAVKPSSCYRGNYKLLLVLMTGYRNKLLASADLINITAVAKPLPFISALRLLMRKLIIRAGGCC